MGKIVFDVDEIHALRIELAERRARMTPEEAQLDFAKRVERGRRAIEELRAAKAANAEPRQ